MSTSPKRTRSGAPRGATTRGTRVPADQAAAPPADAAGVFIARLVGIEPGGRALVALEGKAKVARIASAAVMGPLGADAVGGPVAVAFEGGRPDRPVVLGPVRAFRSTAGDAPIASPSPAHEVAIELDGRRLVLTGAEEIVLRCGAASITLSADGRVAVRGTKVVSRASGVNKIKGGAVQIN